jgi:nicotinamidase/pyrazinamidase
MWPVHCVQGSHGAEFHPAFDRTHVRRVFHKGVDAKIDSYSAFWDNAKRRGTGLYEFLRAEGVDEITLMGLATDYCVRASALDAITHGFAVTVVEDGCRAVELVPGDGARAIEEMRAAGVKIVRSDELR